VKLSEKKRGRGGEESLKNLQLAQKRPWRVGAKESVTAGLWIRTVGKMPKAALDLTGPCHGRLRGVKAFN
jgi:hypothetical protein